MVLKANYIHLVCKLNNTSILVSSSDLSTVTTKSPASTQPTTAFFTGKIPITDDFGQPILAPLTDQFHKPVTDDFGETVSLVPQYITQTRPTPSPPTDMFGRPYIMYPKTDEFKNPILVPKTDANGNPVTDASGRTTMVPEYVTQGVPTVEPPTDKFGNPILSPKTDEFGIPLLNPQVTDAFGQPHYSNNTLIPQPYKCVQGWSPFMNVDNPKNKSVASEIFGGGDIESLSALRQKYSFCAEPSSIKCQSVNDKYPYTRTGDVDVICNVKKGLLCMNRKQADGECEDYEVSVYCDCGGRKQS